MIIFYMIRMAGELQSPLVLSQRRCEWAAVVIWVLPDALTTEGVVGAPLR